MKVGACGAGSTGKTTTMKCLSELTNVPLIPSRNREVFVEMGIIEVDQHKMTPEETFELQDKLFKKHYESQEGVVDGLFDRTALDHYVYCLYRNGSFLNSHYIHDIQAIMLASLKTYDQILFFPASEFHYAEEDGLREVGLGYTLLIDAAIRGVLLEHFNRQHWIVQAGTPEERAARIFRKLTP